MRNTKQKVQNSRKSSSKVKKNSNSVQQKGAEDTSARSAKTSAPAGKKKTAGEEVKQEARTQAADTALTQEKQSAMAAADKRARKEAKERKKTLKALRLSDSKARRLLNMVDIGLAFHDLVRNDEGQAVDYRVREVNPAFEAMLELSADAAVGNPASTVYGTRGKAPFIKDIAESIEAGEARAFEGTVRSIRGRLRFSVQPMDKDLFALLVEDASQEAKARRRTAFLETRLKTVSDERKQVAVALNDVQAEARDMRRQIKTLQKDLDMAVKEAGNTAAALQRESGKTQRLEAAVEVASLVRDKLRENASDLSKALKVK